MKLAFPQRAAIDYPIRHQKDSVLVCDRVEILKHIFFMTGTPLSRKFCIFHFSASHSEERYFSSS